MPPIIFPAQDQLLLQPIHLANAEQVYSLMEACYPPVYAHLWEDGGAWYLHHVFSPSAVARDLEERDTPYWFVEWQGQRVGILRLCLHQSSPEHPSEAALKLHRIYLHPNVIGLGIGKVLLNFAIEQAQALHKSSIWLEAMDTQTAALGFYEKMGFTTFSNFRLSFERMHENMRGMVRMQREIRS